jgi:hypothetical protein
LNHGSTVGLNMSGQGALWCTRKETYYAQGEFCRL